MNENQLDYSGPPKKIVKIKTKKEFKCLLCDQVFVNKGIAVGHIRYRHTEIFEKMMKSRTNMDTLLVPIEKNIILPEHNK